MPRIIAGRYRGTVLHTPEGLSTRPTSDRVKEAIFSMLESIFMSHGVNFSSLKVLDLYAGSGAMGLEALSRGAAEATFGDFNPEALNGLRKNIEKIKATQGFVIKGRWPDDLNNLKPRGPFNLIFLDPPYADELQVSGLLNDLTSGGLAAPGAWLLWEYAATKTTPSEPAAPPDWVLIKSRTWGRSGAAIFRLSTGDDDAID